MNLDLATVSPAVKSMPAKRSVQARNESSFEENLRSDQKPKKALEGQRRSEVAQTPKKLNSVREPRRERDVEKRSAKQAAPVPMEFPSQMAPLEQNPIDHYAVNPSATSALTENLWSPSTTEAGLQNNSQELNALSAKLASLRGETSAEAGLNRLIAGDGGLPIDGPMQGLQDGRFHSMTKASNMSSKAGLSDPSQTSQFDKLTILKFMDSIESEMGVPREKFAEAMVNVSSAQPNQPASETVDEVIGQLNLPPEQAAAMKLKYQQLVNDVEGEEATDPAAVLMAEQGSSEEAKSKKAAAMATLRGQHAVKPEVNLDKVNGAFFLREGLDAGQFRRTGFVDPSTAAADELQLAEGEFAEIQSLNTQRDARLTERVVPYQAPLDVDVPRLEQTQQGLMAYGHNSSDGESINSSGEFLASSDQGDSQEQSQDQSQNFDGEPVSTPGAVLQSKPQVQAGAKAFAMQNLSGGQTKVDAGDVTQFVSQANSLVKQGGGEMKMILQPEGLGQVDLKVAVQNGNVQVEMMADTAEARQLLEKSMGDLRSGLSAQDLVVDEIKVELAEGASRNQFEEKQNEADQQMSRDLARGFLENFRNSSHFHRDEMMGINGLRTYGQKKGKGPDVKPIGEAESNSVEKERGKGRNLSLVA